MQAMNKGSVVVSFLLRTGEIDLEIVDPSAEVVSGPSSPCEEWSRDNRVLVNGEMIFWGDVLLAHVFY